MSATPIARTRTLFAPLALVSLVALAGCADRADNEQPPAADQSDTFPVTLTLPNGDELTIDERPEAIVSLAAPHTETLFAVGAGDQVIAVDEFSNYPEQAPTTDLSGFTPSTEAIADYDPDLVVVSEEGELPGALEEIGITTLVLPAPDALEGAYEQFEIIGAATGHAEEGEKLAQFTAEEVARVVAEAGQPDEPLSYYHELDDSFYTATSATFIGEVYAQFGLTNIADGDDPTAHGGYPQLSAEVIIDEDPDLIFLANTKCCGQNLQTVAARPGWDVLTAVKEERVIELDDDIASRWSPRIVELVAVVGDAISDASD